MYISGGALEALRGVCVCVCVCVCVYLVGRWKHCERPLKVLLMCC